MRKFLSLMLFFFFISCSVFSSQEIVNDKKLIEQEEISANEDLMREHGILNRLLLIYQEISRLLDNHEQFDVQLLEFFRNLNFKLIIVNTC